MTPLHEIACRTSTPNERARGSTVLFADHAAPHVILHMGCSLVCSLLSLHTDRTDPQFVVVSRTMARTDRLCGCTSTATIPELTDDLRHVQKLVYATSCPGCAFVEDGQEAYSERHSGQRIP